MASLSAAGIYCVLQLPGRTYGAPMRQLRTTNYALQSRVNSHLAITVYYKFILKTSFFIFVIFLSDVGRF